MKAKRTLTVGIVQLRTHPAVIVGQHDYLQEISYPVPPSHSTLHGTQIPQIENTRTEIRKKYIEWAEARTVAVMDALVGLGPLPDLLVFPECSIPGEVLPALRSRIKGSATVICAGTHTPTTTAAMTKAYQGAGVPKNRRERLPPDAPAVLPVITAEQGNLYAKSIPSIFERVAHIAETTGAVPVRIEKITVGPTELNAALFVCAEALALPTYTEYPDLAVIVAMERNPARFDSHIDLLTQNGVPSVLANSADVGGSGVFLVPDRRAEGWWFDAPFNGRLPAGDCYLELHVNLDAVNPTVGTSRPPQQYVIQRLTSILHEGHPSFEADQSACTAAYNMDASTLGSLLEPLAQVSTDNPLLLQRWSLIHGFLRAGRLSPTLLDVASQTLYLPGVPSLTQLEGEFLALMERALTVIQQETGDDNLDDKTLGRLVRTANHLRREANDTELSTVASSHVLRSRLALIGRDTEKAKIRNFALQNVDQILVVNGLEGIGKTAAIIEGLAQSEQRTVRIRCVSGTSADYLFEVLLRAAGRVPSGLAPRVEFSVRDIADALSATNIVWIEDAHYLTDGGVFNTVALNDFFRCLVEALKASDAHLVIESRAHVELKTAVGQKTHRFFVPGLETEDAVAFLERELKKAEVPAGIPEAEDKSEIVKLVTGHPGMLALCAEVVSQDGSAEVLKQLRAREGFFLAAVEGLVTRLHLGTLEKKIIAALLGCTRPVPTRALQALPDADKLDIVVRHLVHTGLLERTDDGVELSPLIREAASVVAPLSEQDRLAFHARASKLIAQVSQTSKGVVAYTTALQANYHAYQAGVRPPFPPGGLFDDMLGAALARFKEDDYEQVVRLLEPARDTATGGRVREDLWDLLAQAYAKCNNFEASFAVARELVHVFPSKAVVFLRIGDVGMKVHRYDHVHTALALAQEHAVTVAGVYVLQGRLLEREHRNYIQAAEAFREAVRIDQKDGWLWFFLGRCLILLDELDEAQTVLDRGYDLSAKKHGIGGRNLQNAIYHQQMLAMVHKGDNQGAVTLANYLLQQQDLRAEVIVAASYVKAVSNQGADGKSDLALFDAAMDNLSRGKNKAPHARAETALFRGKLLEQTGRVDDAEREYVKACQDDPHNVHMRICHARAIETLLENTSGARATTLAAELKRVNKAISGLRK